MNTFIFDVDNTITPARQKIEDKHIELLNKLILNKKIYLVSGSDYEKLKWQLSEDLLFKCAGVFSCLGNCYHIKQNLIYKNNFPQLEQQDLIDDLNMFVKNSKTPIKTFNHIEKRTGMINVSSIGRGASQTQRKIYVDFDKNSQERDMFSKFLKQKYSNLDVSIGGEISIDISVLGYNKSQILKHIDEKNNLIFFGDKCNLGGNDEPLAKEIAKIHGVVYNVRDHVETFKILKKLINYEQGE